MALTDIINYEGKYAITEEGNVWSHKTNKFLKPAKVSKGYLCVRLDGKTKLVHRLIAMTLIPNKNNKPTVNHIDGDKTNNHINNLEWCTYSENHLHAFKTGLNKNSEKQRQAAQLQGFASRKFTNDIINKIRNLFDNGMTQTAIAKKFETSQANIHNIVKFKTYSEVA